MDSQNPMLSKKRLERAHYLSGDVCTIDGTISKSSILLAIAIASTAFFWNTMSGFGEFVMPALVGAAIVGLVLVLILMFKPHLAPYIAPAYAAVEGVFLGILSRLMEAAYPGIVVQAVLLTFGVAALMLALYRTRIVVVTQRFRTVLLFSTLAIVLVYFVGFVLSFFGIGIPYIHESGPIGIVFSLVVVAIAALNLLLDFDAIERAVKERMPKFMEWFFGFALLVTVVWLYIEILRLLGKLRDN